MTMLDVMIAVGGLTDFAAGNRATLVRTAAGRRRSTAYASTIWCATATSRPTAMRPATW